MGHRTPPTLPPTLVLAAAGGPCAMRDRYGLVLATAPTAEPITVTDVEDWLRIDPEDSQGAVIALLITEARERFERVTGRALLTQTWRLTLPCFPAMIELPRPPAASVTSITYVDTAGNTQTLSTAAYRLVTDQWPGRIEQVIGQVWPATYPQYEAVKVTYTAGWSAATSVPTEIKLALLQHVAYRFLRRGEGLVGEQAGGGANAAETYLDGLFLKFQAGGYQ